LPTREDTKLKNRAIRFDFIFGIGALIVSISSVLMLGYQTNLIQQQYSATIWPYLSVSTTTNPDSGSREILLENDGLGPALVRSAQLEIDGKPASSWNDYLAVLMGDLRRENRVRHISIGSSTSDLSASTIVRAGQSQNLLKVFLSPSARIDVLLRHSLAIEVCYCSLNNSCWQLRSVAGKSGSTEQGAVARCPTGHGITSNTKIPA